METQKRQSIDLLNVLKYLMVLVFLAYIVFLVSRESADDVPVKTLQENVMKAGTEEGMTKGTTQDLKRYYGLNAQDYDGVALYIPNDVMSVNELLIIKLKDESQAEQVEAAAKERLKTQKTSFEGYGAKQTKLLESAVLDTKGEYVLLARFRKCGRDGRRISEKFVGEKERYVIQQYRIFIYIFTNHINFILCSAKRNEESGASAGKPDILCLG